MKRIRMKLLMAYGGCACGAKQKPLFRAKAGTFYFGHAGGQKGKTRAKIFNSSSAFDSEIFPYASYGINCTFTGVAWCSDATYGASMRKRYSVKETFRGLHVAECGGMNDRLDGHVALINQLELRQMNMSEGFYTNTKVDWHK